MFLQCVTMCWYRALKIMIAFVSSPLEDDILPREILFDYLARIESFYGHWNRLLFWFLGQFCDNKCRVCSLEISCSYMIVVNIIFEYIFYAQIHEVLSLFLNSCIILLRISISLIPKQLLSCNPKRYCVSSMKRECLGTYLNMIPRFYCNRHIYYL